MVLGEDSPSLATAAHPEATAQGPDRTRKRPERRGRCGNGREVMGAPGRGAGLGPPW